MQQLKYQVMKKFLLLAGIASICLTSCNPDNGGGTNVGGELYEGTVILDAQQGSTARKLVVSDVDWTASNTNQWFMLSAMSGPAGESELGIISTSANEDVKERVGSFKIGTDVTYVVQRGIITTNIDIKEALVTVGQKEVLIPITGTFPIADIDVNVEVPWASYSSIELIRDSELLADGETYSNFYEAAIRIAINEENNAEANRKGSVMVIAGEQQFSIDLVQLGTNSSEVDYTKDFYRATVAIKGTGTWCGYCPPMAVQLHETEAKYPDRFYVMNVYNGSGSLSWEEEDALLGHYNLNGFPNAYANGYVNIPPYGSGLADMAEGLIHEAIKYYPSNVAIAASSEVSGDNITLDVRLAAKASKEYKITVYLMEDGIVKAQEDYEDVLEDAENFVHNGIVRETFTDGHVDGGNAIDLPIGEIVTKTFNAKVPSSVVDVNNTRILVYVTYEGGPNPEVPTVELAEYKNYGYIIDNAVVIPTVGGEIDFRYEE